MDKRVLQIIGIVAIIIIAINIVFLIFNANSVKAVLTGKVSQGEVNITVGEYIAVNFTSWQVNFGTGSVDAGETNATVCSRANVECCPGCEAGVCRGNWTSPDQGLIIENEGNINLSIGFSSSVSSAADFLGGTNPQYLWRFHEEFESCLSWHEGTEIDEWYDVNATRGVCDYFPPIDSGDEVWIDFILTVPSDSLTDARGDQITAIVSASA